VSVIGKILPFACGPLDVDYGLKPRNFNLIDNRERKLDDGIPISEVNRHRMAVRPSESSSGHAWGEQERPGQPHLRCTVACTPSNRTRVGVFAEPCRILRMLAGSVCEAHCQESIERRGVWPRSRFTPGVCSTLARARRDLLACRTGYASIIFARNIS